MAEDLFVTGTDTSVGKTVLSALLVAALDGAYWKPIQTGAGEVTDRQQVMEWAQVPESRTAPESHCFEPPVSPHLAAQAAGITIDLDEIARPESAVTPLIIEGAGGVMVPINGSELMLDLIKKLAVPAVVAARSTLGTINHTLLTVGALRGAGVELKGVVMIGRENKENENAVEKYGAVPIVGRIPMLADINRGALVQVFETHFDRRIFS
jgi:dethiobiotin synthase